MLFIELRLEAAEILKGCPGSQEEKKLKKNLNNPRQTLKERKKVSKAAAIFPFPGQFAFPLVWFNYYEIV